MRPVRILQTSFHREWNGQVARIFLLSRELARRGHRAVIAAPAGSALARRAGAEGLALCTDVRFRKINRPLSFLRDVLVLGRLGRAERFDILHTHGSQDTWAAIAAARFFRLGAPVLMTRHNTKSVRFDRVNRWLYGRGISRLVVVSRASLEIYRRFYEAGVLRVEDIAAIHSCVDFDRFATRESSAGLRAELGVADEAPLVGVIGRVSKDKGHEVLLAAAPAVLREFPDAVFVFAGKMGRRLGPAVRAIIRDRGLEKSFRLLGFREDIARITAALDVSVLPATGTDSSPAGPVVASRLAGMPEIVPEGAGMLVPPGDAGALARAIVETLSNRKTQTAPKIDFPRQFTPEFMCDAYLDVYERLLGPAPARP